MANKKNARGDGKFVSRGASRGGRPDAGPADKTSGEHAISANRRRGFAGGDRPYDYAHYESEPATPEYMERLFARHSFAATKEQLKRFWTLYELLRRDNASLDLTRIMGIEATVLKHFVDSAIILRWAKFSGPVLDIGTGPGFPGLPLAIMRGDLQFILAESRGKRVGFLEAAVKALGLKNVKIFPKSVREDSPLGDDHGMPVGDVVTRALETISPTLGRILPYLRSGGKAVFMKGPDSDAEIAEAVAAYGPAYRLADDVKYVLPGTDQKRRLVIFQRI